MGKKWPVKMNLPFFAVEAYVRGGGVPESGRKKMRKNLPSGRYRYKNLVFQFFESQTKSKEFPQREANLAIFHRKMHCGRNRIVTAEQSQPISQKESLRTV